MIGSGTDATSNSFIAHKENEMEAWFWIALVGSGLWLMWLATFKTDTYLVLKRDHDQRVGKVYRTVTAGGFRLLRWWFKK